MRRSRGGWTGWTSGAERNGAGGADLRRRWLPGAWLLAAIVIGGSPLGAFAQEASAWHSDRQLAFLETLQRQARGAWIATNAAYGEAGEGVEEYGLAYELLPGGQAALGCLWGETDRQVVGVYWQFFMAWDPVAQKGMVYQANPDGTVGFGSFEDPPGPPLIQTFVGPNGTGRIAHSSEYPDEDTHVSGSLTMQDGEWVQQDSWTWHLQPDRLTPCIQP